MSTTTFWRWTDRQRQKRDYSWLEFEKRAGMSNGGIKKRYEARDIPSVRVCAGIAKGQALIQSGARHYESIKPATTKGDS